MISHAHRCIFVEIPKTGSTSIRRVIGSPPKPHLNICQIRQEMMTCWTRYGGLGNHLLAAGYLLLPLRQRNERGARQFAEYFKFGFVRNPWDRIVSLYLRRQGLQMSGRMTFPEFVDWARYSSSTCVHPVPHTNQLDWLVDPHGDLMVDFIGRFESLQSDWAQVAKRLGLPTGLPRSNTNPEPRKHYSEWYDARTREVVRQRFAVDIEYFGYRFEA